MPQKLEIRPAMDPAPLARLARSETVERKRHEAPAFRPQRLELPDDAPAEDVFRATLQQCLQHIARNVPVVAEGRNPDGIHQMRVALRKLRAALTGFGPAFRNAEMDDLRLRARSFAKKLGATRDLDVFGAQMLAPVEAANPEREDIAALRLAWEVLRTESWEEAVAVVRAADFAAFLLDLAAAIETCAWRNGASVERQAEFLRPARELGRNILNRRRRKVVKRARHLKRLDPAERHRLRIALKKLRYSAEFFAPLFPGGRTGAYLRRLSKTQDDFGDLNDIASLDGVLLRIVRRAERESGGTPDPALRSGAAFVSGWHHGRGQVVWRDARKRWKRLRKTDVFWR